MVKKNGRASNKCTHRSAHDQFEEPEKSQAAGICWFLLFFWSYYWRSHVDMRKDPAQRGHIGESHLNDNFAVLIHVTWRRRIRSGTTYEKDSNLSLRLDLCVQ